MRVIERMKKFLSGIYMKLNTRTYHKRLHYLFQKGNGNRLIVVFSAFGGEKPRYNYIRTLRSIKDNKVFILDDFGYKGSYYLMEGGCDGPKRLVTDFLRELTKKYDSIITLGSSKGGTAALYYGLEIGANQVMAGACQYYISDYLNVPDRYKVLEAMGGDNKDSYDILNKEVYNQIKRHTHSLTHIKLLYSKSEHTYEEHIKDLLVDLKEAKINCEEFVLNFNCHDDVGKYFAPWIVEELTK